MPAQCCRVSFIDAERIEHAVEVSAASLYEACVFALAEFRRTGFTEATFGPATQLTVSVRGPAVAHTVSVAKLRSWLLGGGKSPNELATKKRLREVLRA